MSVSSPVGELRYQPQPPWSDEGPGGMRLAWQPDEFGCLEACVATMLGIDFEEVPAAREATTRRPRSSTPRPGWTGGSPSAATG